MKIYYHDNGPEDRRLPHRAATTFACASASASSTQDASGSGSGSSDAGDLPPSILAKIGIIHHHFPRSSLPSASLAAVDQLAAGRDYAGRDEVTVSPAAMGAEAYARASRAFFAEHMHEDEEIRYVLEGAGYFDVRDGADRWIRIRAEPGDLLILPAGLYHRFTVDESNYIRAMRLFQTQHRWASLNRSEETDSNEFRVRYLAEHGISLSSR